MDNDTEHAGEGAARKGIPRATYRLQFHSGFRLADALELVPYLAELGVSHVYASPLFQARPGSTHGYDVCDPTVLNAEIGTERELARFAEALHQQKMGLLLDIVPNHMGIDESNRWWMDVLEKGRSSAYAGYFDIQWDAPAEPWKGKVLLPVLGDRYGKVLGRGELKLVFGEGRFQVAYYDKRFPVSPESTQRLLGEIRTEAGAGQNSNAELLQRLAAGEPEVGAHLERVLATYHIKDGTEDAFVRMNELLREQHYRLAFWRTGPEQLNYRRFFDITDLVAVKVETTEVFEAAHDFLFRLMEKGIVSGVRVDHPDGLWDPKTYFERLQEKHRSDAGSDEALYLLVEKILSEEEMLPDDWPVAGTTGYDYLNYANGLFVDSEREETFTRFYREFTGQEADYETVVAQSKVQVLRSSFIGEMNALVRTFREIAAGTAAGQDYTARELEQALEAFITAFPVYRTYVNAETKQLDAAGECYVKEAVQRAKLACPKLDPEVPGFLERLLLLKFPEDFSSDLKGRARAFIMSLQQLTGPAMAKGLEDTTFYRYFRLVSLNEVGGNPGQFGIRPEEFHEHNRRKHEHWPDAMLASATHDTKRGEDLRARLDVLSELPEEWAAAVRRWSEWNAAHRREAGPSRNDEYLFYQTVAGAWTVECRSGPGLESFSERVAAYMLKAIREGKLETSWTEQNQSYEEAVSGFVKGALAREKASFIDDLHKFAGKIGFFGYLNSLAQVALKITSPGMPDFYQGTELWDFSLVDPDNRRPVDFGMRAEILERLGHGMDVADRLQEALARPETGEIKLWLTTLGLRFRREHPALFRSGRYHPLRAAGSRAKHVVAFAREMDGARLIVVVPRLVVGLTGGKLVAPCGDGVWEDTVLELPFAGEYYRNVLTGETVEADGRHLGLGKALLAMPVALLHGVA